MPIAKSNCVWLGLSDICDQTRIKGSQMSSLHELLKNVVRYRGKACAKEVFHSLVSKIKEHFGLALINLIG